MRMQKIFQVLPTGYAMRLCDSVMKFQFKIISGIFTYVAR